MANTPSLEAKQSFRIKIFIAISLSLCYLYAILALGLPLLYLLPLGAYPNILLHLLVQRRAEVGTVEGIYA